MIKIRKSTLTLLSNLQSTDFIQILPSVPLMSITKKRKEKRQKQRNKETRKETKKKVPCFRKRRIAVK